MADQDTSRYAQSGVTSDLERTGLPRLLSYIRQTFSLREGAGVPLSDVGYYANIIDLPGENGLAVAADGVGTKILIAEMLERYDTVAQDVMAMNVNDLICIGAEPIAFLNYLGIDRHDPKMLEEIGRGLYEAAKLARVTIPGGETAQVGPLLGGVEGKPHFDLTGTALGLIKKGTALTGEAIAAGDTIIGVASSGLHSNGYSLVRKVLLEEAQLDIHAVHKDLGEPLGDALIRPTLIYVQPVMDLLRRGLAVHAINHITGGGVLNLLRVQKAVRFVLEHLPGEGPFGEVPALPPIFRLVQRLGGISTAEMYEVFNMGVGLAITCNPADAEEVLAVIRGHGHTAWRLGRIEGADRKEAVLPGVGLIATEDGITALDSQGQ